MKILINGPKQEQMERENCIRYYEATCINCKTFFCFTNKDLSTSSESSTFGEKYTKCPVCNKRIFKDNRKGFLNKLFQNPNGYFEIDSDYYYELIDKYDE